MQQHACVREDVPAPITLFDCLGVQESAGSHKELQHLGDGTAAQAQAATRVANALDAGEHINLPKAASQAACGDGASGALFKSGGAYPHSSKK